MPRLPRRRREAITARPRQLLSLYAGSEVQGVALTGPLYRALLRGEAWARFEPRGLLELRQCVALCWPAPLARAFLVWCDAGGDGYAADADDGAISRRLHEASVPLLVSVPSLVEHDAAPSFASRDRFPGWLKHVAAALIGEHSALDVAWTQGIVS